MSKFTTPEQFIAPSKVMLNNLTLVSNIAASPERLTALTRTPPARCLKTALPAPRP